MSDFNNDPFGPPPGDAATAAETPAAPETATPAAETLSPAFARFRHYLNLDRTLPPGRRAMVLPGQLFAFYDWGGTYDKSTVDKVARVVVTVDYRID